MRASGIGCSLPLVVSSVTDSSPGRNMLPLREDAPVSQVTVSAKRGCGFLKSAEDGRGIEQGGRVKGWFTNR